MTVSKSVAGEYKDLRRGLYESKKPGRTGTLEGRVFDDGFVVRFIFSDDFDTPFVITSERTEYNVAGNYTSWWIANKFEVEYETTSLNEISSTLETD